MEGNEITGWAHSLKRELEKGLFRDSFNDPPPNTPYEIKKGQRDWKGIMMELGRWVLVWGGLYTVLYLVVELTKSLSIAL